MSNLEYSGLESFHDRFSQDKIKALMIDAVCPGVFVFGVRYLRRILTSYSCYYDAPRMHLSLDRDAPLGGPAIWSHGCCVNSVRAAIIATRG